MKEAAGIPENDRKTKLNTCETSYSYINFTFELVNFLMNEKAVIRNQCRAFVELYQFFAALGGDI